MRPRWGLGPHQQISPALEEARENDHWDETLVAA